MRKGLFRKGGELLVVVLAFVTEYALEVAAHAHIATFASVYIIVMESLAVTENGQYVPGAGVDGYSDVTVQVPDYVPVLENLEITENGEYFPDEGIDGASDSNIKSSIKRRK